MSDIAIPLHIDLLYFGGCPSYARTQADLAEVLAASELDATVRLVEVQTPEQADALHFAGSPTVKLNGIDLEGYDGPGVLACRVYRENGGRGWPSKALLESALVAAVASDETPERPTETRWWQATTSTLSQSVLAWLGRA